MRKIYISIGALYTFVLLLSPLRVAALSSVATEPPVATFAGLLITEIQPGSVASASEEFIEIYNYSGQRIDFNPANWYIAIASSAATKWTNLYRTIPLSGSIEPGGTYIVASEYKSGNDTVKYLPTTAKSWFNAGIAATGGHVRLAYYDETSADCSMELHVLDTVEWSASSAGQPLVKSIDGRNLYVTPDKAIGNYGSLQRIPDRFTGGYTDTDNDATDFFALSPTPGVAASYTGIVNPVPWTDPTCVQPTQPSPPSDLPDTTTPPPTGGSDDEGPGTESPVPGPDGEGGTGDSADQVPGSALAQPQISELLPNPASPQTDAADEYIELFNPNTTAFDISGYAVEAGQTTKRRYVFPAGTVLQPLVYKAFYVTQTNVSLTNDTGRARLLDVSGAEVSATDVYSNAPEGKAWAYIDNAWQWTVTPTPNASNSVALPIPALPKKTATATKKTAVGKAASVKAATTKKATAKAVAVKKPAKAKQVKQVAAMKPAHETKRPIHGGVLAVIGVIAVLYGAYEYRHDVANKFHQHRSNRAVRRKNRAGA